MSKFQGNSVMRATLLVLAASAALFGACSRKPAEAPAAPAAAATPAAALAPATAAPAPDTPISGVFTAVGKPAALSEVVAYKGEPESDKAVTVLVFSTKDQAADATA